MDIMKDKDGKPIFVGKEDPENKPVSVRNPLKRYCSRCNKEYENDAVACLSCGNNFNDGKMQCPICNRFFEYLVGDDVGDGKRGCEGCWKPPTRKEHNEPQERPQGQTFD